MNNKNPVSSFNIPAGLLGIARHVIIEIIHSFASIRDVQQVCFSFLNSQTISFFVILNQFLGISKVTSSLIKCDHFSLFGNPAVSDISGTQTIRCSWKPLIAILVDLALTEHKKSRTWFLRLKRIV
jgi:hypothetical protein